MTDEQTSEAREAAPFDAPADTPEDRSTGYAVYDRTLGRYVGPVTDKRPSRTDARDLAPGHVTAVVRV